MSLSNGHRLKQLESQPVNQLMVVSLLEHICRLHAGTEEESTQLFESKMVLHFFVTSKKVDIFRDSFLLVVCVCVCVCVCVFTSIHCEGFICLEQLGLLGNRSTMLR